MVIKVLLFARAREAYGKAEVEMPHASASTPAACFDTLCSHAPRLASLRESLLVAVNESYAAWDHPLEANDEVAFIPPVSGG